MRGITARVRYESAAGPSRQIIIRAINAQACSLYSYIRYSFLAKAPANTFRKIR